MILDLEIDVGKNRFSKDEIELMKINIRDKCEYFAFEDTERIIRKRNRDENRKTRMTVNTQFEVDDEGNIIEAEKTKDQLDKKKYGINYYKHNVREVKIKCVPCNANYSKYNINNHNKTAKHIKNMEISDIIDKRDEKGNEIKYKKMKTKNIPKFVNKFRNNPDVNKVKLDKSEDEKIHKIRKLRKRKTAAIIL